MKIYPHCKKKFEVPKQKIQIKNRFTDKLIFESETATTIKEAVEEAIKNKVSLCEADLSKINLSEIDLIDIDLSKVNFSETDLSYANLSYTNLNDTELSYTNLSHIILYKTDLTRASLFYCKMDKKVFKQLTEEWFEWKVE